MTNRLVSSLLAVIALACNGPLGLLPGGKLAGESRSTPSDWNGVAKSGTVQLETRPEDPYSVNISYRVLDGVLYINAGDTETEWVKNIAVNPDVVLRLDGSLYSLRAQRVSDPAEIARFGKEWTGQSMFLRDPANFDEVWVYRLTSR
ncbi:MAG: hypothetical protein AAEJ53_04005 [Myxococcota bacterium]